MNVIKNKFLNCINGFTLAEVLITLVIIGVIAALTIPTAIAKYQKTETVSRLKKSYTMLLNAAQRYQADTGVYITDFDTSLSGKEFMEQYFNKYLQIAKHCENDNFNKCYGSTGSNLQYITGAAFSPSHSGVILNDGSFLGALSHAAGVDFIVDINGAKKPNRMGRDVFSFYLINPNTITNSGSSGCASTLNSLQAGIYPGSAAACFYPHALSSRSQLLGTSVHRSCNKNATNLNGWGDACAAVIMMDSWQIKDDYPW